MKRQLPPRLSAGSLNTVKTGIRLKRPSGRRDTRASWAMCADTDKQICGQHEKEAGCLPTLWTALRVLCEGKQAKDIKYLVFSLIRRDFYKSNSEEQSIEG